MTATSGAGPDATLWYSPDPMIRPPDNRRSKRATAVAVWPILVLLFDGCGRPTRSRPGAPDAGDDARLPPPPTVTASRNSGGPTAESDAATGTPTGTTDRTDPDAADPNAEADGIEDGGPAMSGAEAGSPGPPEIPVENREKGERPDGASLDETAPLLLEAIRTGDAAIAIPSFFPVDAFDRVKNLPDPRAYHRRMVRWFEEDVRLEHAPFRTTERLDFDRFEFGRCTWTAKHDEGNLLPYWSCRHNRLFARADGRPVQIGIRVMINWGPRWYVVHLGPVRR